MELAAPILTTWVRGGVYDDLLAAFGDGLGEGMTYGLGRTAPTRCSAGPGRHCPRGGCPPGQRGDATVPGHGRPVGRSWSWLVRRRAGPTWVGRRERMGASGRARGGAARSAVDVAAPGSRHARCLARRRRRAAAHSDGAPTRYARHRSTRLRDDGAPARGRFRSAQPHLVARPLRSGPDPVAPKTSCRTGRQ